MKPKTFDISVDQAEDGVLVRMVGSCTMEYSGTVGQALIKVVDQSTKPIVVDISKLDFIDSGGLGGLIEAYLRCRRLNRSFQLAAPQPRIQQMLALTRLTDLMPIQTTVPQATPGSAS